MPMSNQQRLALINTGQLFDSWRVARDQVKGHAYGLRWKNVHGRKRLFRQRNREGQGTVVQVEGEAAERLLRDFTEAKGRAGDKFKSLTEKLDEQARLNRALRISRAPAVVARICQALDAEGLGKEFEVIGTNAMFAYEAAAGVVFLTELLASGDIDLLYDARKRLVLVSRKLGGEGLSGLLRRADRSFHPLKKRHFRAVNDEGFLVDLVIPKRPMVDSEPITFGEDDLVAAEVPGLQWLVNSPKLETIAVDERGWPFPLRVPDPRAFALHKAWLSSLPDREPVKRPRDLAQARAVAAAVREHMPNLPFVLKDLTALHGDVRAAAALIDAPAAPVLK